MIIQNASLAKREGLWNIYIENGIFKKSKQLSRSMAQWT